MALYLKKKNETKLFHHAGKNCNIVFCYMDFSFLIILHCGKVSVRVIAY